MAFAYVGYVGLTRCPERPLLGMRSWWPHVGVFPDGLPKLNGHLLPHAPTRDYYPSPHRNHANR
jgi:hypothetical protein